MEENVVRMKQSRKRENPSLIYILPNHASHDTNLIYSCEIPTCNIARSSQRSGLGIGGRITQQECSTPHTWFACMTRCRRCSSSVPCWIDMSSELYHLTSLDFRAVLSS